MINKEVSDGLSRIAYYFHHLQTVGYHGDIQMYCEYEKVCFDALALLKEQEAVIRCKDCNRRLECNYWIENGDNWFCADWERK